MITTIILITWPLVGILAGIYSSKTDQTTLPLRDFVACIILGPTLIVAALWGHLIDVVIKKNPVILDFRKKD